MSAPREDPAADWVLVIRPDNPGGDDDSPPPEVRIRRLLKHALRVLGLRCVSLASPAPGTNVDARSAPAAADDTPGEN